jgi:hypothetical protein
MKNPQDVANKWSKNLGQAVDSIKAGVNAVQVSPMQLAAAQQDAYLSGIQNAVSSGKWQRGLGRVSLQSWQQSMLNKGLQRISSGAAAAVPKMAAFQSQWLPYMDQLQQKLTSMPRGSAEANRARMNAAFDWNRSFVRQ